MREKSVEQALVRAVRAAGGLCPKWVSPGNSGVPDRIVLLPGARIAFVEVKAPGKHIAANGLQAAWQTRLQALGFYATVLCAADDIPELLARIRAGPEPLPEQSAEKHGGKQK